MTFADQLKEQLINFVESYRKYFLKTFFVALIFTVLCFVASAALIRIDVSPTRINITNLVGLLFYRYSFKSYQIIDLASIVSFFFIAMFSLLLSKISDDEMSVTKEFSFDKFMSRISGEDIIALLGTAIIASLIDYLLFKCAWFISLHADEILTSYFNYVFFHLRQYIPLMLYAVTIRWLTNNKEIALNFKDFLFLFLVLWIFNAIAFEFYIWIRDSILNLLLLHFAKSELLILYQSLFSLPIMGAYFVGYYSALTKPFKILSEPSNFGEDPSDSSTEMP
jgi:hypothetical protein